MNVHGWNISGGRKGKRIGFGAMKQTTHAAGAVHIDFRSLDVGLRKRGALVKHIPRKNSASVNLGDGIKIGQTYRGHSFHVNQKKAAYAVGGAAAVGVAAYGAHRVYKRHQAQKAFNQSLAHHGH